MYLCYDGSENCNVSRDSQRLRVCKILIFLGIEWLLVPRKPSKNPGPGTSFELWTIASIILERKKNIKMIGLRRFFFSALRLMHGSQKEGRKWTKMRNKIDDEHKWTHLGTVLLEKIRETVWLAPQPTRGHRKSGKKFGFPP